ncbi:glucose N-acetyltransferase [Aspergillus luchuensis]|uniref:Glucose N-acetyltransferase n=2 Tax=Aspergillus kawachii TaxID=1069201 RepID=A0A146FCB3_ASPKA|nr:glucose N-acetyltransferase [Aspergillus luchuensis]
MLVPSVLGLSPRMAKALFLVCGIATFTWGLLSLSVGEMWTPSYPIFTQPVSRPKHAFATIITGEGDTETDLKDVYFTAARLLTYQLLYSPQTKSRSPTPFVVLVTDDVPQDQRDTLERDGAIVVPAENLARDWIHPKWSRWSNVLAKLNLWRLTEYEKITFLDADTIIIQPLDDIFFDNSTAIQETIPYREGTNDTNFPLPETYLISGIHDRWVEMALPPEPGRDFYVADNYVNAGFFVFAPSQALFDYYVHILDTPDQFDASYPEQNLLNFAHRTDGRMPWRELSEGWNQKPLASNGDDLKTFKSLHQKWWRSVYAQEVNDYIMNVTLEMENYFHDRFNDTKNVVF